MAVNDFIRFFRGMGGKLSSNLVAGHGQMTPQSITFLRQIEKDLRKKQDLAHPLNSLEVVVFDIETTGFSPEKGDKIISIGAIKMKGSMIIKEETFYSLIRTETPLSPEISALTKIDNEELQNAPEASEVLMMFFKFISSSILIAHHSKHEQSFMQKFTWDITKTKFQHRIIDTSFLTQLFDPSSLSQPLEKVCQNCGIEVENRHNALGDALMTAKVWSYYLKKAEQEGYKTLGEVYEQLAKLR